MSSSAWTVRPMEQQHLEGCANIIDGSSFFSEWGLKGDRIAQGLLAEMDRGVADLRVLVDVQDHVQGFAWLMPQGAFGRSAYLRLIAISEELRQKGGGRKLMDSLEREYLDALMPMIESGHVDVRGQTISAKADVIYPVSASPEVTVAALGPQSLKVAGRLAAGTNLAWVGPKTIRSHIVPTISDAAAAVGRPAPRIIATLPIGLSISADICASVGSQPARSTSPRSASMSSA